MKISPYLGERKGTLAVLAIVFDSANILLKPLCARHHRDCWKFKEHRSGPLANAAGEISTRHPQYNVIRAPIDVYKTIIETRRLE